MLPAILLYNLYCHYSATIAPRWGGAGGAGGAGEVKGRCGHLSSNAVGVHPVVRYTASFVRGLQRVVEVQGIEEVRVV